MSVQARTASRLRGVGLAAVLLPLAACAAGPPTAVERAGAPQQIYARALADIGDLALEPVAVRRIALAGLQALSGLDGGITVGGGYPDMLTLRRGGRDIARFAEPPGNDEARWGERIGEIVGAARQASPPLAAMPPQRIEKAVFQGMVAALDPFSRYLDSETAGDLRAERDGFGGIGVTVDTGDHLLRVAAVSPQGPADRAGIRPEDEIVAIDGVVASGISPEEAIHRLRGPVGSSVVLRVLHPGGTPSGDLQLQRAMVSLPTVTMTRDGNIAVFRISGFNNTTAERVAAGITEAQRQGGPLAGIVLDLRGNPGGLLDQAVSLADLFIRHGPILAVSGRHPASRQYFAASGRAVASDLPLAVLINGGSASASEIVAAALQDAGRAVVIGSASYGKGTVQTVLRLPNGGELILTWARLVAPAGYLLQHHGVVPTLCTADLPDGPSALAATLGRLARTPDIRPRAALDEAGWSALRQSCPPRRTRPAIDGELAERVLADPPLYAAALRSLAPAAQIAQHAAPP